MTDRTWTGNVDNSARNPGNWDPTGAPQPGDNLLLPSGSTINVTDDDLHSDPLVVSGANSFPPPPPTTINLSHHAHVLLEKSDFSGAATVDVNVKGTDSLNIVTATTGNNPGDAPSLTVSLADNARLLGSFNMRFGALTISDGDHARYVNNGTDSPSRNSRSHRYGCHWFRDLPSICGASQPNRGDPRIFGVRRVCVEGSDCRRERAARC